MIDFQKISRE